MIDLEFDIMCDKMGIPKDRARLVKRNLQLKGLLEAAIESIEITNKAFHDSFGHVDEYDKCEKPICVETHKLINKFKAEMNK